MMPIREAGDERWVGLFCEEMPEPRFADVMIVKNHDRAHLLEVPVDALFRRVVAPGSIVPVGIVPDVPVAYGAVVIDDILRLHFACEDGHGPRTIVVTLSGVRRGRAGIRFPGFTREQAIRNNAFWDGAYQ